VRTREKFRDRAARHQVGKKPRLGLRDFGLCAWGGRCYEAGMRLTESCQDGMEILHLNGEIDLQFSPVLRKALQGKIKERVPVVVMDFSGVEYIDSSGLATLVEYCRDSRDFGGKLILVGLSERVRTIFDLVRLNELLTIYGSIEEAKSALAGSS
jgi:anti-sigma B factor antagonist